MKRIIITLWALALSATSLFAQAEKIRLYEGKAPGSENWTQQEYLFEYTTAFNPGEVGECILNVVDPELWAYLPAKGTETGAAIVVCPGGGFTAAFVVAYLRGDSLAEAQRIASETASYVCSRKGAMPD